MQRPRGRGEQGPQPRQEQCGREEGIGGGRTKLQGSQGHMGRDKERAQFGLEGSGPVLWLGACCDWLVLLCPHASLPHSVPGPRREQEEQRAGSPSNSACLDAGKRGVPTEQPSAPA